VLGRGFTEIGVGFATDGRWTYWAADYASPAPPNTFASPPEFEVVPYFGPTGRTSSIATPALVGGEWHHRRVDLGGFFVEIRHMIAGVFTLHFAIMLATLYVAYGKYRPYWFLEGFLLSLIPCPGVGLFVELLFLRDYSEGRSRPLSDLFEASS
jgi:hypothetical protein